MTMIRASMQSNSSRIISDLGVGGFPNYHTQQEIHKSQVPVLGSQRSGVLGHIAKNEIMKTQEGSCLGEQRIIETHSSQSLKKTLSKPKQLQPLLQMNYQIYRSAAQNVFQESEDTPTS